MSDTTTPTPFTSFGRQIQVDGHVYTVMGGSPSPYLLHRPTAVLDLPGVVAPLKVLPGERIRLSGHLYVVMGGAPEHRLGHAGIAPGTTWSDHKWCGGGCELSPGGA